MKDDMISRQAAIDALKRTEALSRAFGYHAVIDAIEALPSAQPEPIRLRLDHELSKEEYEKLKKDCAEQPIILLPKESAQPLQGTQMSVAKSMTWTPVTDALPIKSGVYLVCNKNGTVFTAMYLGSHWGTDGVIAWMETPEPYKEDDHEPN